MPIRYVLPLTGGLLLLLFLLGDQEPDFLRAAATGGGTTPSATPTPTAGPATSPSPSATRRPSPTEPPTLTPCPLSFTDVPPTNPFYFYVRCLACRGVLSGYTTSPPCAAAPCFLPDASITRGQAAKIIGNAAHYLDPIPSTQQTFTDVPYGSPFWLYIERVAGHGGIHGYNTSPPCPAGQTPCFLPNNPLTRGELAKIDSEVASYLDTIPSTLQTFVDVPWSSPFWYWIEEVHIHGVISGYSGDGVTRNPCTGQVEQAGQRYFRPCNSITRAQTAKIIGRTFYSNCQIPARGRAGAPTP